MGKIDGRRRRRQGWEGKDRAKEGKTKRERDGRQM